MDTNTAQLEMEHSVERIAEALSEIHFPNFSSFKLLLHEFTRLVAEHYDLFDHEILKNISLIEVNLKSCNEEQNKSKSLKCWDYAKDELASLLTLLKKESVIQ